MSTTTPLTDKIQALTTYANSVTGASDSTLSEAVATLAAGYGSATLTTKSITANGTYTASDDSYDGYSSVTVAVESESPTGTKSIIITANGTTTEDVTDYASAEITVAVSASGWTADEIAYQGISGDLVLSSATRVHNGAFYGQFITSASSSTVTRIDQAAFQYCASMTTASFTACSNISSTYAFANCTSLTSLSLPALTSWSTYMCSGDTALATVDLGLISSFQNSTFQNCSALRTLILRRTSGVCSTNWYNANVFGGIYNNPTESTIYVPSALISSYQSASNWSTAYSAGVTFAAIEGSDYENYYADGTAITS